MPSSTTSSRVNSNRRIHSLQEDARQPRKSLLGHEKIISHQESYSYALRVAFLAYLLQPRQKRLQHVTVPAQAAQRSTIPVHDLLKDFSRIRDSKSTRFPHGFMTELDKRITYVLIGKEKRPEYGDSLVKRSFAAFLNAFKEHNFRKSMEKDRRVEDLLLIFFSNATKEMQKGKGPEDDSWKQTVDRHVALFVRLVIATLRDHDWARDRSELMSKLQTTERKLLTNDQNLAITETNGGTRTKTTEIEVPRTYAVKDMPLAIIVSRIYNISYEQVQTDINQHKSIWTEQAALQDLKIYHASLNLRNRKTLNSEDFDLEEAYQDWKISEIPDLSQMMLNIIQSNPELAKTNTAPTMQQNKRFSAAPSESSLSDISRNVSDNSDSNSMYAMDQTLDINALTLKDDVVQASDDDDLHYTFIPTDPRMFYRAILWEAFTYDLYQDNSQNSQDTSGDNRVALLSKGSTDLLNEIACRWRVPEFSRFVLFLDVVREKFDQGDIGSDILDAAFNFIRQPQIDSRRTKRSSLIVQNSLFDRTKWTVTDYLLNKQILNLLHKSLLRELYTSLKGCYGKDPPSIATTMDVLHTHIYDDPLFSVSEEELNTYEENLRTMLREEAMDVYRTYLAKEIPELKENWQFAHVISLGKVVIKQCQKTQKKFKKMPEIMGVNPMSILVEEMLPAYAADARDLVARIMELAYDRGEEIPIQDGFDLYSELVEIRRVHADALPDVQFGFHIEELLKDFVWRWINITDQNLIGWVEEAVKQDDYAVRSGHPGNVPDDDERHSVSIIDIFRSFNQSIEQIVQLNWDNDLHYAKFMTAMSKSIGNALARYCELVEIMFSREMNRLTPEQELAARQTKQEKWMQMAKDAWAHKETVEPFQFLPESLVKLNNIEYATLELDKLEHEINVDACAEVIQKHTPPPVTRQKKTERFVFTIKIIEAEDLRPCDMNGLSDPYVVLGDEFQKRLAKTRIVYGSLNPRWDETIDITTTGPLNIIATIWDWDVLGDHDCVGRTSLKLDPSHFRDYLPKEYWLDLDTQGRVLLRVSMEGERDDIQFYFGKAFRNLKRTERDMARKITDKLSAFIHHSLSQRALKSLLSKGISMSTVSSYFQRNRSSSLGLQNSGPTQAEIANALKPLFTYFDENFAIMNQTLTNAAMITVMSRLWKEVLSTVEALLVPPLSDKPSQQKQLTQQELDVVFKWLELLFDFFHAVDEDTGIPNGVPIDILKSPKYHDLQNLNFFYFESTENLMRTSEAMASANAARQQEKQKQADLLQSSDRSQSARSSAVKSSTYPYASCPLPSGPQFGGAMGLVGLPSTRRSKSVMHSRNLGTIRKAKEEKRKEAQAEPSDDMILRILRMRPAAEKYLRDRSRQKERLAAAAAAEMIVRQSLNSGGGRMAGILPQR